MPRIVCDPNTAGSPPEQWHEGGVYLPGTVGADNWWHIPGNADVEGLKTRIYINSEQQRRLKNHPVTSPRFHTGASPLTLKNNLHPSLTLSGKTVKKLFCFIYWQLIYNTVSSQNSVYFKNYPTFLESKTGLEKNPNTNKKKSHALS